MDSRCIINDNIVLQKPSGSGWCIQTEYVWTFFSIFSWIKTPQDIKIKMLMKFVNPWFHAVLKM